MKKYIIIIIVTVTAGILLLGGGLIVRVANQQEINEEPQQAMTPEELIAYFGFTEEEIENVDIERFLQTHKTTKESLQQPGNSREDFLNGFEFFPKEEPENLEGRSFTYIVFREPLNGVEPDYSRMKYIAYERTTTYGYSVFIDVKACKVYISPLTLEYVYQDIAKAQVVLEDVDLSEVIEGIANLGIEDWEGRYEEDAVYGIDWRFGIEFEDGTIASYSGYEKFPENYSELEHLMFSFDYRKE